MLKPEDLDALRWARDKGIAPKFLRPQDCLVDEQGNVVSLVLADAKSVLWLPTVEGLQIAIDRVLKLELKVLYQGAMTFLSVDYLTKRVEAAALDQSGVVLMFLKRLKDVDQQRDGSSDRCGDS